MTDTRFAPGPATAYVTDHVLALGAGGCVDAGAMALCATGDWGAIVARADEHRLVGAVMHHVDHVRLAVCGDVSISVAARDGDHRFDGTDTWTTDVVERAHHVTLATVPTGAPDEAIYRTDGGAIPASVVSRRLGAPLGAPADPFDALFGHTVARSVEAAAVRLAEPTTHRPAVGFLVFSTGERVVLDTDLVLGRHPRPNAVGRARPPRLVEVSHPGVSRHHASIHLDCRVATIEDLGSLNGTTITVPGAESSALRPGAPYELPVGASVELGVDVSFSVEAAA